MVNFVSNNKHKFKVFRKIQNLIKDLVDNDFHNFYNAINENGQLLEELGVVNNKTKKFLDEIREQGGYCKISGAGGESKEGSGIIICFSDNITLCRNAGQLVNRL